MRIVCEIPIDDDGSKSVKELVEALARIWARRLRKLPLPALYRSAIRYEPEQHQGKFEDWQSPIVTFERGLGDCDDLVIYRLAELLAKGENASVQVMSLRSASGVRMHVRVRRGDGSVEDPSILLGAK